MAIRHIIFDCDGVLVDSESLAAEIQSEMFAQLGVQVTAETIRTRFVGHTARELWLRLAAETGLSLPPDFLEHRKRVLMAEFSKRLRAVEGVPETLPKFTQVLSVASNSEGDMLVHKLKSAGICNYFAGRILSIDSVAKPKPAPDLYLAALSKAGIPREESVVIEDTPIGIASALAAGIAVIGFTGASHNSSETPKELKAAGASMVLADFRRLPAALAAV